MTIVANIIALLVMPILITGTMNRVKARWAGRVGPPLFQLAFDIWRLLRKTPVYSTVTTPVFRLGPAVVLVTAIASACIVPLAGTESLVAFPFDFVWFAYVWSFGRGRLHAAPIPESVRREGVELVAADEPSVPTLVRRSPSAHRLQRTRGALLRLGRHDRSRLFCPSCHLGLCALERVGPQQHA